MNDKQVHVSKMSFPSLRDDSEADLEQPSPCAETQRHRKDAGPQAEVSVTVSRCQARMAPTRQTCVSGIPLLCLITSVFPTRERMLLNIYYWTLVVF